ncbi:hypothetical protein BELINDA_111 [Bacillus phage Belinda]|nr:hypothetical protein BI039_gp267 [Bacillus phage Belinda]ANM46037.1 hypothetical protein BELINDA_111 [Bacillus phage Belinda]
MYNASQNTEKPTEETKGEKVGE